MLPKRQVAERLWDLIVDRYRAGRHGDTTPEPTARPRARRSRQQDA